jgi:hypothetical protein
MARYNAYGKEWFSFNSFSGKFTQIALVYLQVLLIYPSAVEIML